MTVETPWKTEVDGESVLFGDCSSVVMVDRCGTRVRFRVEFGGGAWWL